MNLISPFLHELWNISVEAGPYLLLGFGVATLMHRFIPAEWMIRLLGKGKFRPTVTAAAIGIPLPLCSCSVVPTALAIKKKGASRGATLAFFISTPETGVDSILLTYGFMGPVIAIARPLAAAVSAIGAGWLLEFLPGEEKNPEQEPESCCRSDRQETSSCCHNEPRDPDSADGAGGCSHSSATPNPETSACCCSRETTSDRGNDRHDHGTDSQTHSYTTGASETRPGWLRRETARLGHSFTMLFDDVAVWILLGFVLSALAAAFIPDSLFESAFGKGWLGMGIAVLVGLPIYVCATASTPLAAVMVAKGFSVGAALVFLLVGPATNIGTVAIVSRILGKWAVFSYLILIVSVSVLFGAFIDLFFPGIGQTWAQATLAHHTDPSLPGAASALLIWGLLLWRTVKNRFSRTSGNH